MNAGKESDNKSLQKLFTTKQTQLKHGTASKTVTNPLKSRTSKFSTTSNVNATIKAKSATATVSKITKLVLKPKPTVPKISLPSKVTTKNYITKPVTIKSRSTVISHESTFCIRKIKKSPPNKRQTTSNAVISRENERIPNNTLVLSGKSSDAKKKSATNKSFTMPQGEQSANITSLNLTKIVDNPVLQEITSAVVNGSNVLKSSISDFDLKIAENAKENQSNPQMVSNFTNFVDGKPKFDPIKARQFIRMQQQKHNESKMEKVKTPATKEEVKQRLSALRKSTMKIVEKNVQKARKSSIKPTNTKTFTSKNASPKITPEMRSNDQQNDLQTPQLHLPTNSKWISSNALTPSKFLPSIKSDKNRIGILRRPEGISPTFDCDSNKYLGDTPTISSAIINQSESNVDLNILPNKSVQTKENPNEMIACDFELKVPETIPLKSTLLNESTNNDVQNLPQSTRSFKRSRNEDENENRVSKPKEIPFWLRPTPVQPYPYNFIMAVRKKLESITHPVFSTKQPHRLTSVEPEPFHSPVSRPSPRFLSQYRRNLDRKPSESDKSMSENIKSSDVSPEKVTDDIDNSMEQEEYSMDFSSATQHSKHSQNGVLSMSKRKSVGVSQDTLSISSGILSHSSPEKRMKATTSDATNAQNGDDERQPSPLTTDNIDGLHITSHTLLQTERESNGTANRHSMQSSQPSKQLSSIQSTRQTIQSAVGSHINFGRGKDYSNKQPTFNKLNKQTKAEEMFKDFTSSLSQVIEVNQRLHNLLSNPPPSFRQKYSDDFENESPNEQSAITEQIDKNRESTTVASSKTQHTSTAAPTNSQISKSKNDISSEFDEVNPTNGSTATKVADEYSNSVSNKITHDSSKRSQIQSSYSIDLEESPDRETQSVAEHSSRTPKRSSTLIDEKIDEYQSSETQTNNDLKSISLSIAKKSISTSDDTDHPSNAIESFNKQINGEPDVANESIGSGIFTVFNETTNLKGDINTSIWSEHNISYSTLGMCDQLLKSETRKSEDLISLLKMREKALIDRFKGQIAWLELQKQKFKETGLTTEISAIKKKQRALLLRLNNDRKELHRILKQRQQTDSTRNASNVNFNISHMTTNMSIRRSSVSKQFNDSLPNRALKAIELPGGGSALEIMLQRRENELKRRREHVEKLLKWHQRLDIEEDEVIKMEQMIMFISTSDVYQTSSHEQINDTVAITVHHHSKRTSCQRDESSVHENSLTNVTDTIAMEQTRFEHKKQKQIHKIEKGLNALKMISSHSISSDIDSSYVDDIVEIFGRQLNKLWKRLTGEIVEKYSPDKVYTLSKLDLEVMYEQAKSVVLKQFHASEEFKRRLIDNSISIIEGNQSLRQTNHILTLHIGDETNDTNVEIKSKQKSIVPTLNLTSSPEPRENVISDTDQGYYFSSNDIEQTNEPNNETEAETVVEAPTCDVTSQKQDSSQIQTEEPVEEDDESTSPHEDVPSDITEDSLNKPKPSISDDISPSQVQTVSQTIKSGINESHNRSSVIPSAIETSASSVLFELNTSNNSKELINESFPNIDIQTTDSSVVEDVDNVSQDSLSPVKIFSRSQQSSEERKYRSDEFEEPKSPDELTSISTATVTKIATTTPTTTTTNQASDKSTDRSLDKSSDKTSTPCEYPKELEQRLILIDEGLRELNETISHSPVLQSDQEIQSSIESNASEKSTGTTSPSLDDENKSKREEKTTDSAQSEETLENTSDKITDTVTETATESMIKTENEPSAAINGRKVDSDESTDSIAAEIAASKGDTHISTESLPQKRPFQYTLSGGSIDYNKVPEADALKRAQVPPDTESKVSEQSSSIFPLLREIPNKPPPPYPVDRQLPKTPPFPADDRIKEIVYHRIKELYEKPASDLSPNTPIRSDATFVKSPTLSVLSPESPAATESNEINVFERIILDCCEEIMQEINSPEQQSICVFRQPLEFFNPANRLACYQQYAFKRIFKLLNRSHSDDGSKCDESKPFNEMMRTFLPSQVAQLTFNNRRKRDHVDEILIQELYEDEARWTNFDLEEKEIRDNVPDLRTLLADDSSEIQEISTNASVTE